MPERMDWKNALCATNNFRYKLIRYKENVYAVDWLPHWYSVFAGIFICFFKKKAYILTEQQAAVITKKRRNKFAFYILESGFNNIVLHWGKMDITAGKYRRKSERPVFYSYFAARSFCCL